MEWVKFPLALWYRSTRGMSDAEKGALMDKTIDALVDETPGVSTIADKILDETRAYLNQAREAGRKGGLKRAENAAKATSSDPKRPSSDPKRPSSDLNQYIQTNKQTDSNKHPNGCVSRADAREAGATPAPPAPAHGDTHDPSERPCTRPDADTTTTTKDTSSPALPDSLAPGLAERLAEAMRGAPLSVAEALDYAKGPHCGLTPPQVLEWADWNSERGWKRDSGGNLHPLSADGARSSMRRWKNRQPEIDRLRKRHDSRGGAGTANGSVRGVRIAGFEEEIEADF